MLDTGTKGRYLFYPASRNQYPASAVKKFRRSKCPYAFVEL
jgi:hypothetical protein